MKPLCLIPARGGSKRLPKKNILPFKGKPLLEHSVQCALQSGVFAEVVVSSDCPSILQIAEQAGAIVVERDQSLAQDTSTVNEVCLSLLNFFKSEMFCCLYPTAVLLKPDTLAKSYQVFRDYDENEVSTLMAVSKFNYEPVQALVQNSENNWEPLMPQFLGVQSQNFPDTRVSNGTFYWARSKAYLKEKTFYSQKMRVFDVPDDEAIDINTPADYQSLIGGDLKKA